MYTMIMLKQTVLLYNTLRRISNWPLFVVFLENNRRKIQITEHKFNTIYS